MVSNGSATATIRYNNANIINISSAAAVALTGPNSRIVDQNGAGADDLGAPVRGHGDRRISAGPALVDAELAEFGSPPEVLLSW